MTCASGPALPPGNVCRAKTLICSVIRGDSACLLFMVKMNSGFKAFCWRLQGNNKHLSPQLISVLFVNSLILIGPCWRKTTATQNHRDSVQTTYSLTDSTPIIHTYSSTDKLVHTHTHTNGKHENLIYIPLLKAGYWPSHWSVAMKTLSNLISSRHRATLVLMYLSSWWI